MYDFFTRQYYKMEYEEYYKELFHLLKNNKTDEFIKYINNIDKDDPLFDINIRDEQNNYFLTYAIIQNRYNIVSLLIEKGCSIDIIDNYDRSILIFPIQYAYDDILELLLRTNKYVIGLSIVDIRDKYDRIPLHYAIDYKNMNAIKLLTEYGSNLDIFDRDGYNSLHLAVRSRSLEICKYIVKHISNINARCNTGETALHIACNFELYEISKLLIDNNINVNIVDFSKEISCLHYTVLLHNNKMTKLLLDNDANPNVQDTDGNTPLHLAISEKNFEIFSMLLEHPKTINILNLNLWNVEGLIPLHIVLKYIIENASDYIDMLMNGSNLSIQDNDGYSCLHYMVIHNVWQKYKSFLVKKRLDIFLYNNMDKMPIDYIKESELKDFLDVVIDSYLYRLKNANELWYYSWENVCSKDYDKLTDKDIKILEEKDKKYINKIENFEPTCKSFIKKKIVDMMNKIHKKEKLECFDQSFPMKRINTCIEIFNGENINFCTFTGNSLDVLVGLLYLLNKHKNTCSTISVGVQNNQQMNEFYKSLGIIINTENEILNFEIIWGYQRLYIYPDFVSEFNNCIKSSSRFIIIPLGIIVREGNHAGYLIYDKQTFELERFEPHGSSTHTTLNYNHQLLDNILENKFKYIIPELKYIRPSLYLPKIGLQILDIMDEKHKHSWDPSGFCALWAIWYVDMRLLYYDIDRKEMVKILINSIKAKNISFKQLIRNYSQNIVSIRDNILQRSKMNINDWYTDQYTTEEINSLMNILIHEFNI